MSDEPYSVDQLCEKWRCDKNQLHSRIKTHNMRLLVYLKNITVLEAKINEIDENELSKLRKLSDEDKLSDEKLEQEGFCLTDVSPKNSSEKKRLLAKKNNAELIIIDTEMVTTKYELITLRNIYYEKYMHPVKVGSYGYYELCEESYIDIIDNLFSGKRWNLNQIKCEREGYIRFVKHDYSISLQDIYIPSEEVNRVDNYKEINCFSPDDSPRNIAEKTVPNHNSQTEEIPLQPETSPNNDELLKKHQKEIGSKGGRKSKIKEALALLATNEIKQGRGYTAFRKILKEHSPTELYDGIDECSEIYLDGNRMCYTEHKAEKSVKTSISINTMKRYFTDAKK